MYKASVENRGDSTYYATTRHAGFALDTAGKGANPIDTLLASLCSCMGHYVRDYLVDRQITHSGFSLDAEAGVTPDKARLAEIQVRINLGGVKLDERQTAEMLQSIENCKVHNILKVNPGVKVSLTGQGADDHREHEESWLRQVVVCGCNEEAKKVRSPVSDRS